MSKNSTKRNPTLSAANSRERVKRAFLDARYQTALDLAKQLHKEQPSPEHRELLLDAVWSRAQQLYRQGNPAGAVQLLNFYFPQIENDPLRVGKFVAQLAAWGEVSVATSWRERLDEDARQRLDRQLADAFLLFPQKRPQAPAPWQADIARVEQACHELAEGKDDAAAQTLQGIGLQSPYLEWRVFLRGLLAYYQRQDERARQTWQRLGSGRLPAQLAAPFRFIIDPAFRDSLDAATRANLQAAADQLTTEPIEAKLRQMQQLLAGEDVDFSRCFRLAQEVLPPLRQSGPPVVEGLARCFYWNLVRDGVPEDVDRFDKVFAAPPDDPHLNRLRALATEQHLFFDRAHEFWQKYDGEIAAGAAGFSAEEASQARALIWLRMGKNAKQFSPENLPPPLRRHVSKALKPDAVACFRKAIALAPDLDDASGALFDELVGQEKPDEAEACALAHLARRPTDLPALRALADLRRQRGNHAGALESYQQAVREDPLDLDLRSMLRTTQWRCAAEHAARSEIEPARTLFEAALADPNRPRTGFIYALWAAAELKSGNDFSAEELLSRAQAETAQRLPNAWVLVAESKRLKLPRHLAKRFDDALKVEFAKPPAAAEAAECLRVLSAYVEAGLDFHGRKASEKRALKYAAAAPVADFTPDQMDMYCHFVGKHGSARDTEKLLRQAMKRFPRRALYPYLQARLFLREPNPRHWIVEDLLKNAERLAAAEKNERLLEEIHSLQKALQQMNPMLGMLEQMLGGGSPLADIFDQDFEDDP